MVVEICDGSLIAELDLEGLLEAQYREVAVIESSCLSFCGMCARRPYAIVNGKRIFARTAEECLQLIKEHIDNELKEFAV
ncbi:YuzB family protein [Bacillus infantis]|uniref:DUF1450 domain-containing protein n=1 Tax=Bacillus infantis TaxID=324767 RepID=UPI001CD3B6AA|nr:DUF1450 domain-containing protein [Bacillus infantis]MCA1038352.1 YuzB family protein [Bacillus infantis]